MRIAQITTFYHPVVGGIESDVENLSRELSSIGHNVTVLTSNATRDGGTVGERNSTFNNVHIKRFRSFLKNNRHYVFYPGLFFYLLKNKFDIIHVHGLKRWEGYCALLASKFTKTKVVLSTHNTFALSNRQQRAFIIYLHDNFIGRFWLKKFAKIITLVKSETDVLKAKYGVSDEKIVTIPNGLDEIFFKQGNKEQFYKDFGINPEKWEGIVVGVGRINENKGFQNLVTAVKKLKKVLFIIAGGDDGYLKRLKIDFINLKNIIFTEHFLSKEKLINLLAGADIFVLPSLIEPLGVSMLQALAQGLPVIATNRGGTSEVITSELGVLLDPVDQAAWFQAIKELLVDSSRKEKISSAAKEFVKNYQWDTITGKINNIYQTL